MQRLEEQLRFETAAARSMPIIRVVAATVVERIPLPDFIKRPLMEMLLRDVHHYFFNAEFSPRPGESYRIRDELQRRFLEHVIAHAADRPHVIVCHSMGTILTYDCLRNRADCPPIDGLITLGSPLGLDEVQDAVAPSGGRVAFPSEKLRGPWINIYDPLDPVVGFDPRFANDYLRDGAEAVVDIRESNWGKWRHNIVKYLSGPRMRAELKRLLAGAPLRSLAERRVRDRTSLPGEMPANANPSGRHRARGHRARQARRLRRRRSRGRGLDAQAIAKLDREELARLGDEVVRAGTLEGVAATPEQIVALASALRGQRLYPRAVRPRRIGLCAKGR